MSNRVNRIVFYKKKNESEQDLLTLVHKQLDILIEGGYNCFISNLDTKENKICVEFCLADPTLKDEDIPQPCWLFLDELEYLSNYQLKKMLDEAKEMAAGITEELEEHIEKEKVKKSKKSKKTEFDA